MENLEMLTGTFPVAPDQLAHDLAVAKLIKSGAVSVNHIETSSAHYEVFENDVFRVRGYGKYKLCKAGAQSKKGRIIISYCQY